MRRRGLLYLTTLIGGGLVAAMVIAAGSSVAVIDPPPGDPAADILYLPDPSQPGLDLDRARADGARIALRAESLQADTSPHVIGIVFDASQISSLSRPWLASQVEQGRVIAGVNVTMTELEDATGLFDMGSPDGFRHDWWGQPFYSYAHRSRPGSTPHYGGRGSDQLHSPELLFFLMRRQVQHAQGLPPPTRAPLSISLPSPSP